METAASFVQAAKIVKKLGGKKVCVCGGGGVLCVHTGVRKWFVCGESKLVSFGG